jgi:hypothetical protein
MNRASSLQASAVRESPARRRCRLRPPENLPRVVVAGFGRPRISRASSLQASAVRESPARRRCRLRPSENLPRAHFFRRRWAPGTRGAMLDARNRPAISCTRRIFAAVSRWNRGSPAWRPAPSARLVRAQVFRCRRARASWIATLAPGAGRQSRAPPVPRVPPGAGGAGAHVLRSRWRPGLRTTVRTAAARRRNVRRGRALTPPAWSRRSPRPGRPRRPRRRARCRRRSGGGAPRPGDWPRAR